MNSYQFRSTPYLGNFPRSVRLSSAGLERIARKNDRNSDLAIANSMDELGVIRLRPYDPFSEVIPEN